MSTLAPVRGGSVFGDAIRITRLDVTGAPLAGATNMIQSSNLVKFDYTPTMQAAPDITTLNAQGIPCLQYRGRDTLKYGAYTIDICDFDIAIVEMLVGGTIFTGSATRTVADGVTNTDTSLVSATAAFSAGDVGATVSGTGIFAGSTIVTVTNATTAVLSHATTATGTAVSITIADTSAMQGYQPPKFGQIGAPNGCSIEVWAKRIVGDFQVGWWHWAFPRTFWADAPKSISATAMAMSFTGWGNENPNWGSGPLTDFTHDSTAVWQNMLAAALPSPLQDGYQVVS